MWAPDATVAMVERKAMVATVLHGSSRGRIKAVHMSRLCNADGFRASKLQHTVQDTDGDGNLGRLACIGARP